MLDPKDLKPGDVLCIATADFAGWWIRLRSKLMRRPDLSNHVAMFTHFDVDGSPRGLEGRPSGFGWVNLKTYLKDPNLTTNAGRTTFTAVSRERAVRLGETMVGTAYDWRAIIDFALNLVGRPFRAEEWPEEGLPSQVTCASALDLIYESMGWPNPGDWRQTRGTDVDDWVAFIANRSDIADNWE